LRRTLAPLLARERERVVLMGLSRGGTAALDLGSELAIQGMRVGVLAISAPLARPHKAPHTVINIGSFELITENFVRMLRLLPWLTPMGTWLLRSLYIRFCGFVLAELNMVSADMIAMYARYIAACDPNQACLRAVREFALLGRVSDAELRHAVSGATRRFAETDAAKVILCWGENDAWVDVGLCQERLQAALTRQEVPAERVRMVVFDGLNHGVGREPDQDFTALSALLWELCEHAHGST
jgi:pimeloyl-ACP methyl ester carboxylesterase